MLDEPRPEKVAVVEEVRNRLSSSNAAILTEYRGLKVDEISQLRRNLRDAGGEYKVYKNTLVRFAVAELGLAELDELLVGPTAIAFVDGDAVNVAKALRDFGRTNPNLVVKGGLLGESFLSAEQATALAEIPPREELLARFAGLLAAPMQQLAGLLQAVPRNMAYALSALIEKGGGGEAPEPTAPPEATGGAEPEPQPEVSVEASAEAPPEASGDQPAETDDSSEPAETSQPAESSETTETSEQPAQEESE